MLEIAHLTEKQRSEIFRETAARRGFEAAIAEKDFWVCLVLKLLFESDDLAGNLVFKGGTSLSKVYGLIERFSEDIDLILNWDLLGYGPTGLDPFEKQMSKSKQNRFNEEFNRKAASYIASTLCPQISQLVAACPQLSCAVDADDPHVIQLTYPAAYSLDALRPQIRLEIGPLASWVPSQRSTIQAYCTEEFPTLTQDPSCKVTAIMAERTFWEKATILHQQAHRTTTMPAAYSRHYYDLTQIAKSACGTNALQDLDLLKDVVAFKERFYPSGWANYAAAVPGTFRLIPDSPRQAELERDYRAMRPMFFAEPPPWSQIVDELTELESQINDQ